METGIRHRLLGAGVSVLLNGGALLAAAHVFSVQTPVMEPDRLMEVSLEPYVLSQNLARESETPPAASPPEAPPALAQPMAEAPKTEPEKARTEVPEPLASHKPLAQPQSALASMPATAAANMSTASAGQAQAASAPISPTAGKTGRNHAVAYSALVRRHLEMFREYPRTAKRRREEGVVNVTFVINRQGQVLSAKIATSSGHPALDQAALEMVRAAQPLPRPPSDITGEQIEITVPAEFFLMK